MASRVACLGSDVHHTEPFARRGRLSNCNYYCTSHSQYYNTVCRAIYSVFGWQLVIFIDPAVQSATRAVWYTYCTPADDHRELPRLERGSEVFCENARRAGHRTSPPRRYAAQTTAHQCRKERSERFEGRGLLKAFMRPGPGRFSRPWKWYLFHQRGRRIKN